MNKKKQGPPIRETIYRQLVDDIVHGRINACERLSEAALCERFGVSKSPIREALILMEREGYIGLKKNVGAVVLKISDKIVDEIYNVVAVLESYAVETVVAEKKIQKSEIDQLAKLVKMMEEYSKKKKYMEYRPLNFKFHGFFTEKLGNETLRKSVIDLRKRMYSDLTGGLTIAIHIDRYIEWHKKIIEAIKQNNGPKAGTLMKNHVMETKKFLLNTLQGI
ncbi:MAG: GntR family transcriptional regulator [Deltaproteobacteria bacterium]|nr:GntR family transcriptional regulator [Deltaproteobacteria bacterium]